MTGTVADSPASSGDEGRTTEGMLEDATERVPVRGRGREARNPTQIPARGWLDIFVRVYKRIIQDRIGLIAAGVTFYAMMGLFPAIVALVSIYGLVTDASTLENQIQFLAGYLPQDALSLLSTELHRITDLRGGSLGIAALASIAVALWSVNTAVLALFQALNVAYGEAEKRSIFRLYGTGFGVTIGIIVFAVVVVNTIVVLPLLLSALGFSERAEFIMRVISAPLFFVVMVAAASVLYRIGPSRRNARWNWISLGSILFSAVWIAVALGLSFYLSRFANYTATYGSLGAAIGLMLWIYAAVYIFLAGAEINAEIEHQTSRDTTTGPERPMGERGAHVADTVGALSGK
ncbi:YihY/virulence factor BrkB family protein [Amorphus sp. MBR-141]